MYDIWLRLLSHRKGIQRFGSNDLSTTYHMSALDSIESFNHPYLGRKQLKYLTYILDKQRVNLYVFFCFKKI